MSNQQHQNEADNGVADFTAAIAAAVIFKGSQGLAGLLNADEFWERQPYGTRLYYGDGIADYLHRDVLRAAVKLLVPNAPGKPTAKLGLLPCPFCGKSETLDVVTGREFMDDEQEFWPHSDSYAVVCDASTGGKGGCGAIGGFADTEQGAIMKWNRGLAPK